MFQIMFASNNRGKYEELKDAFQAIGIPLMFHGKLDLPENEPTAELNAITKAQAAAKQTGMFAISDDTSFCVEALDYFPGVHAQRWHPGNDHEKRMAILEMMKDKTNRTAYLISRFALANPDGKIVATAVVKNTYEVAHEEHGDTFGYNAILKIQGYYVGDMEIKDKNLVKNRGRIAAELKDTIRKEYHTYEKLIERRKKNEQKHEHDV